LQLPTPEYVRKEAIVVQTPYTVATSRFEFVDVLKAPAKLHIAKEHNKD
jgi:hypothetical protein